MMRSDPAAVMMSVSVATLSPTARAAASRSVETLCVLTNDGEGEGIGRRQGPGEAK